MVAAASAPMTVPRAGTVLSLLAGRGTFRIAYHATALALLAIWGTERFAVYAGAVGATAWLALLSSGPEKTVLKLVPRLPRLAGAVVRTALLTASVPVLLAAAGTAAMAGSPAVIYPLAALWSAGLGLLGVAVAVHRATGRPLRDSQGFLLLAVLLPAAATAVASSGFSPVGAVLAAAVSTLVVAALSMRGITVAAAPRTPTAAIVRSELLLGLYEPLGAAGVGVLYVALAVSGRRDGSATLYLALLVSSVIGAGTLYLLRVYQPASSVRLRGAGARTGRALTRRLLLAVSIAGLTGCAIAAALFRNGPAVSGIAVLVLLLAFEIPLHAAVSLALFVMENTGDRELILAATAAATQFAAVAVLAALLVPAHGPPAALFALVASYTVLAASTLPRLRRRA
ncbi:hypothetical protein [Nocardia sp. NPDC052566]|uniref:hypothetical protein n=1 Tax=Nocardia sp. NPDC052566 TaxID=3364330 RepID=UPI0037C68D80